MFLGSAAFACHEDWSTVRKIADPAGYLFCAEVIQHLDSSGLGTDETLQADERALSSHEGGCHADCQLPGDGFLMGHKHGVSVRGECLIRNIVPCQMAEIPPPSPETGIPVRRSAPDRLQIR
jgi:hypothetical protein